jgi:hypothetical protein
VSPSKPSSAGVILRPSAAFAEHVLATRGLYSRRHLTDHREAVRYSSPKEGITGAPMPDPRRLVRRRGCQVGSVKDFGDQNPDADRHRGQADHRPSLFRRGLLRQRVHRSDQVAPTARLGGRLTSRVPVVRRHGVPAVLISLAPSQSGSRSCSHKTQLGVWRRGP